MAVQVVVTLDEKVLDPDEPLLRADDLGAVRGDGVFETLLVRRGVAREQERHLARLARSAAMLHLPEPDLDQWRRCVRTVIELWRGDEDFALRLILTRGRENGGPCTGYATASPVSATALEQRVAGVSALTLTRGVARDAAQQAPWLLLGAKSLSYATNMAAQRHAQEQGADDVIYTSTDGFVLEGPTSSVVLATGRTLCTPPVDAGILPGTTQAALFRQAELAGWTCEVRPVPTPELLAADGVWLASSVRLLARVHTLDGVPLPHAERAQELTGQLQDLLDQA
ncbi:aminodeoxychorismate lyase [Rhodococcus sp. X156]|uniref:aminodeoxychorismate lyase n=1 Tax=Rhodococcus sp. X156 TaxID=2499145 RepID=UPI000FDBB3AF|nr:aminodeoxychorismate lyase [Rhodococcus sp. X156]